jgi:hypothetical protein
MVSRYCCLLCLCFATSLQAVERCEFWLNSQSRFEFGLFFTPEELAVLEPSSTELPTSQRSFVASLYILSRASSPASAAGLLSSIERAYSAMKLDTAIPPNAVQYFEDAFEEVTSHPLADVAELRRRLAREILWSHLNSKAEGEEIGILGAVALRALELGNEEDEAALRTLQAKAGPLTRNLAKWIIFSIESRRAEDSVIPIAPAGFFDDSPIRKDFQHVLTRAAFIDDALWLEVPKFLAERRHYMSPQEGVEFLNFLDGLAYRKSFLSAALALEIDPQVGLGDLGVRLVKLMRDQYPLWHAEKLPYYLSVFARYAEPSAENRKFAKLIDQQGPWDAKFRDTLLAILRRRQ